MNSFGKAGVRKGLLGGCVLGGLLRGVASGLHGLRLVLDGGAETVYG